MSKLLALIFLIVALADLFASRATVERIRSRLIDYWIFVSELPLKDEIQSHVSRIRRFMTTHSATLIGVVAAILTVLATLDFIYSRTQSQNEYAKTANDVLNESFVRRISESYFNRRFQNAVTAAAIAHLDLNNRMDETPEDIAEYCDTALKDDRCLKFLIETNYAWIKYSLAMNRYDEIRDSRDATFGQNVTRSLTLRSVFNAVVLIIAFAASVVTTLFLLRSMEKARLASIWFCVVDLLLAVAIPIALMTLIAFVVVLAYPIEDLNIEPGPQFDESLARYIGRMVTIAGLLPLYVSKLISYLAFETGRASEYAWPLLSSFWIWGRYELEQFGSDMQKIVSGDIFSIPAHAAQRNWALGLSILFSLTYIVGFAFLMAAKRSAIVRHIVERSLQFFVENRRGPIAAVSIAVAGVLFFQANWK